jgi:putative ABC transport system substrate-binding protein
MAGIASAAARPMVARAQQAKVWRVGYLSPVSATQSSVAFFDAFKIKLAELGYIEGTNLRLDVRRAEDDPARLPGLAAEMVALMPDVIVGSANGAVSALQRATSSIPIVMGTSTDPIVAGFVKSLAKPGANITGLSSLGLETTAKSLELLHAAVPNAKRIAVLRSRNLIHEALIKEAYSAAETLDLTIIPVMASSPTDVDDAFATMRQDKCQAVLVLSDALVNRKIVELAEKWRLPALYQVTEYVDIGGLMSYAASVREMFREAAVYVDKILRGANPADLLVEQPTRLELEVNLRTAKKLGLTIPDSIVARADKVIE